MSFCTREFFVFFTAVFCVYWLLPWSRARVYLLLVASFVFYASWNLWLALLICASTTFDYALARGIEATASRDRRRLFVWSSVVVNLCLLSYFKYSNFFLGALENALTRAGAHRSFPVLAVLLPIGISFYTFEAISYIVDVYRRRCHAERNLAHLLLFILFFPHLVSGPIVRGRHLLPQIRRAKAWNWARVNLGAQLVSIGLFKKLAIADHLALFADPVFAQPGAYRTSTIWIGVLAYSLQIYCDFSGYTDIALGCAHLLGYKLPQSFAQPYFASSISAFWRRWNMSLSFWLRDYVYLPLGGSRGSSWITARNLLVTLAVGGLWHGARWTFVGWGVLHGVLLCLERWWRAWRDVHAPARADIAQVVRAAATFAIVSLAWVLFRAPDWTAAAAMWSRMLVTSEGLGPPVSKTLVWLAAGAVAAEHVAGRAGAIRLAPFRLPPQLVGAGCAAILLLALLLGMDTTRAFIYFQF